MCRIKLAALHFLSLTLWVVASFISQSPSKAHSATHLFARINNNAPIRALVATATTRRQSLHHIIAASALFLLISTSKPDSSNAVVNYDPTRYGDKELMVATSNRLRQNIRDVLSQNIHLAPMFLELMIHDGLSYNASTNQGGPDGTVIRIALGGGDGASGSGSGNPPKSLQRLVPAAMAIRDIVEKMDRSNKVTYADALSFAGAEGLDFFNGPRMICALGKLDPVSIMDSNSNFKSREQETAGYSYPDLRQGDSNEILGAFRSSGLTERDACLLFGALFAINVAIDDTNINTAKNTNTQQGTEEHADDEENEMGDEVVVINNSFGASKFGKSSVQIDDNIFATISKELLQTQGRTLTYSVFRDEKVATWVQNYASNKNSFYNDWPLCYTRLVQLGKLNTGTGTDDF
jgi:hypothetical protein